MSNNENFQDFWPFCPKLKHWYREAYKEVSGRNKKYIDTQAYAIYPKRFYKNIDFTLKKKYDFIFIGALFPELPSVFEPRKWILPFIDEKFNEKSYLQFTDKQTKKNYKTKGIFDHTLKKDGLVPRDIKVHSERNVFDKNYFDKMVQSKFCLCPAGDGMYSMRFYESLMCKCIPIVNIDNETYRSKEESELGYKYYLTSSPEFIYKEEWVEHNYNLFLKYHTLEYKPWLK